MSERSIIFSAPMVRAILEGRKTQTRRVVKPQPPDWLAQHLDSGFRTVKHLHGDLYGAMATVGDASACRSEDTIRCPYGAPGDTLWVREAHSLRATEDGWMVRYIADGVERLARRDIDPWLNDCFEEWVRRSPIHMPRWASRLTLRITDVRVERLQEISEEDAYLEGVGTPGAIERMRQAHGGSTEHADARVWFRNLWDSINGKRAPWSSNPYVWALSFERVKEAARD